jgi:hypothetical protein
LYYASDANRQEPAMRHATCLAAGVLVTLLAGCGLQPAASDLAVGSMAPPLVGEGWLNGDGYSPEELTGKVVVVDVWAEW